jgi:hypothetical protein
MHDNPQVRNIFTRSDVKARTQKGAWYHFGGFLFLKQKNATMLDQIFQDVQGRLSNGGKGN